MHSFSHDFRLGICWIEPTTLFEGQPDDIPADKGGHGVICGTISPTFMPFYETVWITIQLDTHDLLQVRWCSARTSGIGIAGFDDDMRLADVVPREMSERSLVLVGGIDEFLEQMKSQSCLRNYYWTRGSPWLPASRNAVHYSVYRNGRVQAGS